MKKEVLALTFTICFTLILTTPAQDDISDIFDDLGELDATPVSSQPVTPPTLSMPRPAPAQTVLPMPVSQTSVIYTMKNEGSPVTQKAPPAPLDIDKTIALGKEAYGDGNWNRAEGLFEAVLNADPLHTEAIRWLKRIANKQEKIETKSYNATRERMLEDVQASWNTPKAEGKSPECAETVREPTEKELRTEALRTQLETIRFPALSFQDADIQQVVLELSALCRKFDGRGKGVNLVVFGTAETLLPLVTFSGTDLSALETLDIITQISGMKYDIGPNMVSLTPVNYEPPQQMVSSELDVIPSVGSKMALRSNDTTGSGLMDVREFFSTIPFPPGSSAQYNPEFNLLLVHNSPKHIDRISALLEHYNRKALEERSRQVEIETKFIEVAEGALEELGFEWTIGEPGTYLNNDTIAIPGGQKWFSDTLRTGEEAFSSRPQPASRATSFNSLAGAVVSPLTEGLAGTAGELLIQKVKGDITVDLLIRALERQAGSDLLSAPKILAKSGETASIHVGEVRWFPTAYDVVIERYAQPSLLPLDYEEYKTGVMLEVTPMLDPENGTIDLELAPEIRELAGYDEQHVGTLYPDADFDLGSQEDKPGYGLEYVSYLIGKDENTYLHSDRLIARQPVFKTRKVTTTVTIEDGSTIAMGGLIKEGTETFKDSVPILGKIPLLGRLFRSEGERSVKRNLMIFVTANQVDATGHKKQAK